MSGFWQSVGSLENDLRDSVQRNDFLNYIEDLISSIRNWLSHRNWDTALTELAYSHSHPRDVQHILLIYIVLVWHLHRLHCELRQPEFSG